MAKRLLLPLCLLLLVTMLWMPQSASGQAVYGSIIGTVTDPSGAAVPNAKVTVTNTRKGTKDQLTTNADGNFSATHLIPDTYTVRVEAPGFGAIESRPI